MLETLIRLLRERGFTKDSKVILEALDKEIRRVIQLIDQMLDVLDPDTCPAELLDLLASNLGVPFLPSAPYEEKVEYLQKAVLETVPASDFPRLAEILGVDLSRYGSVDEQRLALWEKVRIASEEQINACLYTIGAAYLLGVMTPEQKRLAIKQALNWYRVRGTRRSYEILLRVFGLAARIIPLWTENYRDFWEEPQGRTVFEGGTWYPTPHYALEFRRWTDEGAVEPYVLSLYTKLVREEVQPIQCVLTRVSFVQELVDSVEFSDFADFSIPVQTLDVVYWPYCKWQDRGVVFIPEPTRSDVRATRAPASGGGLYDSIMLFGAGRAVGEWNELAAGYYDDRSRSSFDPDLEIITATFLRSDPTGPSGQNLDRNRGSERSKPLLLAVPAGSIPPGAEVTVANGKIYVDGVETDVPTVAMRDPERCREGVDDLVKSGVDSLVDQHCYPEPRSSGLDVPRDGSAGERGAAHALCVLATDAAEVEFVPEVVEIGPEPSEEFQDFAKTSLIESFCGAVVFRSSAPSSRAGTDFRTPAEDSRSLSGTRAGALSNRYGLGPKRTGEFTREAYTLSGQFYLDRGAGLECYRDALTISDVFSSEDVVEFSDLVDLEFVPVLLDPADFLLEVEVAQQAALEQKDEFCPDYYLRNGEHGYVREGFFFIRSLGSERGVLKDSFRRDGRYDRSFVYDYWRSGESLNELRYRSDGGSNRLGFSVLRDTSFYREAYVLQPYYWLRRDQAFCVEDWIDLALEPLTACTYVETALDEAIVDFNFVDADEHDLLGLTTEEASAALASEERYCPKRREQCTLFEGSQCYSRAALRDGSLPVNRQPSLWFIRSGFLVWTEDWSSCRWQGYPRFIVEINRCGAPFGRSEDPAVDRSLLAYYPQRSDGSYDRLAVVLLNLERRTVDEPLCFDDSFHRLELKVEPEDVWAVEDVLEWAVLDVEFSSSGEDLFETAEDSDLFLGLGFVDQSSGCRLREGTWARCSSAVDRGHGFWYRIWPDQPRFYFEEHVRDEGSASLTRCFLYYRRFAGTKKRWQGCQRDGLAGDRSNYACRLDAYTREACFFALDDLDLETTPLEFEAADVADLALLDVEASSLDLAIANDAVDVDLADALESFFLEDVEEKFSPFLRLRTGQDQNRYACLHESRFIASVSRGAGLEQRGLAVPGLRDLGFVPVHGLARDGSAGWLRSLEPIRSGSGFDRLCSSMDEACHRRSDYAYGDDLTTEFWADLVEVVDLDDSLVPLVLEIPWEAEPYDFPQVEEAELTTWTEEHVSGAPLRSRSWCWASRRRVYRIELAERSGWLSNRDAGSDVARDQAYVYQAWVEGYCRSALTPPRFDPEEPKRAPAAPWGRDGVHDRQLSDFHPQRDGSLGLNRLAFFLTEAEEPGRDYPVISDDLQAFDTILSLEDKGPEFTEVLTVEATALGLTDAWPVDPEEQSFDYTFSPWLFNEFLAYYRGDGLLGSRLSEAGNRYLPASRAGLDGLVRGQAPDLRDSGFTASRRLMDGFRGEDHGLRYTGELRSGASYNRDAWLLADASRRGDNVWQDELEQEWTGAKVLEDSGLEAEDASVEVSSDVVTEDLVGELVEEERWRLDPVSVDFGERFCGAAVYREDDVGVRSCGLVYRWQGHPDRLWPENSRNLWCDPEFRNNGWSWLLRSWTDGQRDGSWFTRRFYGWVRDGSVTWDRYSILFGERYRRRYAECGSIIDNYSVEIAQDFAEEDRVCWFMLTRNSNDFLRDGAVLCWDRTGYNCCVPGDELEIREERCLRWDDPCAWDTPGARWDPL